MAKLSYIAFVILTLAEFSVFQNTSGHIIHKKSVSPWFKFDEKPKIEVPGYRPILEIHKYNGIQINPVDGGAQIFFDSRTPSNVDEFPLEADPQIVDLLYGVVPYLPDVERMHEINLGFFRRYVQLIPLASIDKLRVTFESGGEEKVGLRGKAKLLKLLEIIEAMKLKSFKALYNKKKDVVQSVLNYLNSPPKPQPAPVHPRPPSPVSPSEMVIVPAAPNLFASRSPSFIPVEFPYPLSYQVSSLPQSSTFYNNFPGGVSVGEFERYVLPSLPKALRVFNYDNPYFQTSTTYSTPMTLTPFVAPSNAPISSLPHEHFDSLGTVRIPEIQAPLPPDLFLSGSENVETLNASSNPSEENKNVMKMPHHVFPISTTQSVLQPYHQENSESSSLSLPSSKTKTTTTTMISP